MTPHQFGKAQPVTRIEDVRLLKGHGNFIDDHPPDGALFAHFFYSPIAHGIINSIDVNEARHSEGVRAIFLANDLKDAGLRNQIDASLVPLPNGGKAANPIRPVLAENKVRYVGEPVAIIIAETRSQALDAMELIEYDIDELDAAANLESSGPAIHECAPDNQAFVWWNGDADAVENAFAEAKHRIKLRVLDQRVAANSIETRGCTADWDGSRLCFSVNGQGVWTFKEQLSEILGLAPERVRVTTADVGGGFGMKAFTYPEHFAVAKASQMIGRPIRWIASRSDALITDNAGRDLVSEVEAAFSEDLKLLGYRVHSLCNLGAYNSKDGQLIQTEISQKVLTGVYDIPKAYINVRGMYTNTAPVDAYRGAGRPEAIFMIERLMDTAARQLGVSQSDIRRRNFIPVSKFPYPTLSGEIYDIGNFDAVLSAAEIHAKVRSFPERRAESAKKGKLRGLGICCYIEVILGSLNESTELRFCDDGTVEVLVGTQSNGQGHETAYAQILSQRTGLEFDQIRCVQGDSDLIPEGGGTGGSRSVTVQGASINFAADQMIDRLLPFVAEEFEIPANSLEFQNGFFESRGTNHFMSLTDALKAAQREGRGDLTVSQAKHKLAGRSFPNGAHICELEIDPETGKTVIIQYTVVDDLGEIINPLLVEGQIHGGVAQGVGQALLEHAVFDSSGQLLSGSFMDYAMPRAGDLPFIRFFSQPTRTSNNPIGMKGCGEAGTIGAIAATVNAVQDAVWHTGIRDLEMPLGPAKIWQALQTAAKSTST